MVAIEGLHSLLRPYQLLVVLVPVAVAKALFYAMTSGISLRRSLLVSLGANAVTTALTWFVVAICYGVAGTYYGPVEDLSNVSAGEPWNTRFHSRWADILLWLVVPLCALATIVERWALGKLLRDEERIAARYVCMANILTYLTLIGIIVFPMLF